MMRIALLLLTLLAFAAPARADDISAASRSVVRVVVVAVDEEGAVAGFGHGSGFAVAPNRIVTNAHVVALAVEHPKDVVVGVVPSEGSRSYEARVIRIDPSRDLALLEIQGTVPPIPLFLGPIQDGSTVAALGYPGNVDLATAQSADDYITPLPPTRSMGNYSNERRINGISALLHTANIARGNSGGPLLDQCGRVIGVNTFITRGDDGDSPFAFAIANREVATFLRASGQSFTGVAGECVSMAERLAQDRDRTAEEERQRLAAEEARERARQREIELARAQIQEIRENRVAFSLLLMVLALVSLGAALVMLMKDRMKQAWILGGLGIVFIAAAAALFVTRPSFAAIEAREREGAAKGQDSAASFAGRHSCRLVPDRSRITVSSGETVDLEWTDSGCVNGRTQYARDGDIWRRILVPNGDQTVSVLEVRPGSRQYVVNRYLLAADAMARARNLRQRIALDVCTGEEPKMTSLAEGQEEIRRMLPELPNERLVYDCSSGG